MDALLQVFKPVRTAMASARPGPTRIKVKAGQQIQEVGKRVFNMTKWCRITAISLLNVFAYHTWMFAQLLNLAAQKSMAKRLSPLKHAFVMHG